MRRFVRAAALIVLPLALLSACSIFDGRRSPDASALAQAQDLSAQGHFEAAGQAYLQLAATARPASPYWLGAAEAFRQADNWPQAVAALAKVRSSELEQADYAHWTLLKTELALRNQDLAKAQKLLNAPDLIVPTRWRPRQWELQAQLFAAQGDNWRAIRERVQLDSMLRGSEQSQNRAQLQSLLAHIGSSELKSRATAMMPDDPMYRWTLQALQQQGIDAPAAIGQPVGTLLPEAGSNVREGYQMPRKVALLLPASGPAGRAAATIRAGFFTAYAASANNHAPRAEVRVYDSGSTPASALASYHQAITDGARFIVGPLLRSQVEALLAQLQPQIAMLALNYPGSATPAPDHVAEFGLQPEAEGQQVADQMLAQGLHQAYVIISDADFAQRSAQAFKSEFIAKGGSIAAMATLPAGSVNQLSLIRGLGMPSTPPPSKNTSLTEPEAPPSAGIFISMQPQPARLLLPQLQLARVTLPVFATSHIYAGSDNAAADNDLDGVSFCDAPWLFDAQTGLPRHDELALALPEARGTAARLFAFGMDAWGLLPYLDWMRAHPGSYLPGASGQLSTDSFGRVGRNLIWVRFDNGLAHPANGLETVPNSESDALPTSDLPASGDGTELPPAPANSNLTP